MNRVLFFALLTTTSISSHAADFRDVCNKLSELGQAIMERRQEGVSMRTMMEVVEKEEKVTEITEAMIIDAYDSPRYSTEEMQKKSIENFRDKIYLECIKSDRAKRKK